MFPIRSVFRRGGGGAEKVKSLEMGEQRKNFSEKVSYLTNLGPLGGGDTPFNSLQPGF